MYGASLWILNNLKQRINHCPLLSFQKFRRKRTAQVQVLALELTRTPGVGGSLTSRLGVSALSSSVRKAWGLTRVWQLWEKLWRAKVHLTASWALVRGQLLWPCCALFRSKNWSQSSASGLPSLSLVSAAHVRNTKNSTTRPSGSLPCMCLDWRTVSSPTSWAGSSSPPSKSLRSWHILVAILFQLPLLTDKPTRTFSRDSREKSYNLWIRLQHLNMSGECWLFNIVTSCVNIIGSRGTLGSKSWPLDAVIWSIQNNSMTAVLREDVL